MVKCDQQQNNKTTISSPPIGQFALIRGFRKDSAFQLFLLRCCFENPTPKKLALLPGSEENMVETNLKFCEYGCVYFLLLNQWAFNTPSL